MSKLLDVIRLTVATVIFVTVAGLWLVLPVWVILAVYLLGKGC